MTPEEQHETRAEKSAKRRLNFQKNRAAMTPEEQQQSRTERAAKAKSRRQNEAQEKLQHQANFDLEQMEPETNFCNFQDNPETACLLHHLNSGHTKFREIDNFHCDTDVTCPETQKQMEHLEQEIKEETLIDLEKENLLKLFMQHHGRALGDAEINKGHKGLPPTLDAHHLVCGACGVKNVDGRHGRKHKLFPLSELPKSLHCTPQQLVDYEEMKKNKLTLSDNDEGTEFREVQVHKVMSVYESQKQQLCFHLHPEYVHCIKVTENGVEKEKEATAICPNCCAFFEKEEKRFTACRVDSRHKFCEKPPERSIAAGLIFGYIRRLGLPEPTVAESILIAKVRHFHNIIKIQSNHSVGTRSNFTKNELRSHNILFRHDAPIMLSITLLLNDFIDANTSVARETQECLEEIITVQLVGPDDEIDNIGRKAKMLTYLQARAYVVYQILSVLACIHQLYKGDPKLPDFQLFKEAVQRFNQTISSNSIKVTIVIQLYFTKQN